MKAFAREEYERERFREKNRLYRDANLEVNKLWLTFFPFIELLANAMTLPHHLRGRAVHHVGGNHTR